MKLTKSLYLLLPAVFSASGCGAVENPEGASGMNRLSEETSAYLLAHADNPVNWYAWGDEAFAAAEAENKPIFLSIGYSSCHWCHVMEEESFENPEIAALMNDAFICIKVDREERPDIDNLYMRFTVAMTGSGGWPMTVVMTPDGKPFFAGTYIPPNTAFGRIGMMQLIPSIVQKWETDSNAIAMQAAEIEDAVLNSTQFQPAPMDAPSDIAETGFLSFRAAFDSEYGGFGNAPKFPSPHNLLFLLRYWKVTGESDALDMVTSTLRAIRRGGVYDQIGFGIHRYSTDREWQVPHFEKMLYDQALLSMACLEAYQATDDMLFAATASEIIDYVVRDMTSPDGAFYASEDADDEGGEGAFYTWTIDEMAEVLTPDQLNKALGYWNVLEAGNFSDHADPGSSRNILYQYTEGALSVSEQQDIEAIREILFSRRETRPHPSRDEKILTDWNGLMIASLARASCVLDNPAYLNAAVNSFEFIKNNLMPDGQRLSHSFAGGRRGPDAFLDDYAFLIMGSLELYNATLHRRYLQFAVDLQTELDTYFADESAGGYFFTGDYADLHSARLKESYDGAVPSGNSVELTNLLTLWSLTGDPSFKNKASGIERAFGALVSAAPASYSMMLSGIMYGQEGGTEVLLTGDSNDPVLVSMLEVLRTGYRPWTTVILVDPDKPTGNPSWMPASFDTSSVAAYVCRNGACNLPVYTSDQLRDIL